jgi:hypothetical protein
MKQYVIILLGLVLLIGACKKNNTENPFDDPSIQPPVDTSGQGNLDPNSIQGIYTNIFRPTCANAGCHDGSFEPEFRTIEGAYNTLVYNPVIKNNPAGDFEFRVKPFDADRSVLFERLVNDIDGFSGKMPLEVDPDSYWGKNSETFIQNIKTWINNGAKDMFGQDPVRGNAEPQMLGVVAFANGSNTPLAKNPGNGSIRVPSSTSSIDIWFSFSDDSTAIPSLSYNKIKFSILRDDFSGASEKSMGISGPITEDGYFGDPVKYHHKYTLPNPSSFGGIGTQVYFRVYVKDPQHDVTEIPQGGSFNYVKEYFSIEII